MNEPLPAHGADLASHGIKLWSALFLARSRARAANGARLATWVIAVLMLASACRLPSAARGQQRVEETCTLDHADIWVINWEVDFNIGQTDQTVRKGYDVHLEIRDWLLAADLFREFSDRTYEACSKVTTNECEEGDIRLVAEFTGPSGCRAQFTATHGWITNREHRTQGRIDEAFKHRLYYRVGPVTPLSPTNPVPTHATISRWRVEPGGYGPVRIGMNLADASRAREHNLNPGPLDEDGRRCFYGRTVQEPVLRDVGFMFVDGRLARIDVQGDQVRTPEGVGVGTAEEELLRLFTQAELTAHPYSEGKLVIVLNGDAGYVFETDGKVVKRYRAGAAGPIQWSEGCQ